MAAHYQQGGWISMPHYPHPAAMGLGQMHHHPMGCAQQFQIQHQMAMQGQQNQATMMQITPVRAPPRRTSYHRSRHSTERMEESAVARHPLHDVREIAPLHPRAVPVHSSNAQNQPPSLEEVFTGGWLQREQMKELYKQLIQRERPFAVAVEKCVEDAMVIKVIKQAGKKRLAEALERFAPKPKDVQQDGLKAFAELSGAQRGKLADALGCKQFKEAVESAGLRRRSAILFVQLGRDFLRAQFKELGVDLDLYVKKNPKRKPDEAHTDDDDGHNHHNNNENEDPEWSSAKKRARCAALVGCSGLEDDGPPPAYTYNPELWPSEQHVEAFMSPSVAAAPQPSPPAGFCAHSAANPWSRRPEGASASKAPCVYDILTSADPELAHLVRRAPPHTAGELRVLQPILSYTYDGLEELATVSRDDSLPEAVRQRLERIRNTLEGVYQLQDRRFGLLETSVSLGAHAAAPQVMSYLSRTLYNAQGGTSDGRHLAKLLCRRYLEAMAVAQGATAAAQGECNEGWPAEAEDSLQAAEFALPDQDAFEAALV